MSKSRFALLGMLSLAPSTGYDIKKMFGKASTGFWNESYGQVYPRLKRLVQEGLATVKRIEREGLTDKKVYTITQEGKDEFERWLYLPADEPLERHEMMLKIFFGNATSKALTMAHIETMQRFHEQALEQLRSERDALTHEDSLYWDIVARHEELRHQTSIQWCTESLEAISQS